MAALSTLLLPSQYLLLLLLLLSLLSPSLCQNGTLRMALVTRNAPFVIRQEAGVASYPRPLSFVSTANQPTTYPAGAIVLIGGEAQVLPVTERSLNGQSPLPLTPPHPSPAHHFPASTARTPLTAALTVCGWLLPCPVLRSAVLFDCGADVWASSDSGASWALISGVSVSADSVRTPSAETTRTLWDGARSTDCADADGGLYLIGGSYRNPTNHTSNVTYSTDAVHWDNHGPQAFWRRQRSTCAVNRAKQPFVLGGLTHVNNSATAAASNDVWMSGVVGGNGEWQLVTRRAPWQARQGLNSDFYYSEYLQAEVLYVMNGYFAAQRLNDIWVSTDHGASFRRLSPYAKYQGRMDAQLTITQSGIMVISAGDCGDNCNRNDVWASLDGGYSWGNCCDGPTGCYFSRREDHVQALDAQGRLLIISGSQQNPPGPDTNDVWRSPISFTNPQQVATSCGLRVPANNAIGLRCLPDGFCPNPPNGPGLKMSLMSYAPWAPRFEGGIAIWPRRLDFTDPNGARQSLPAGAIISYGGRPTYGDQAYNDVWASADGLQWWLIGGYDAVTGTPSANTQNLMVDQARTADCYDAASGRMYFLGGTAAGNVRTSSVWTSVDAGMNWERLADGPFPPREAAACVVDSKGVVYLMGGTATTAGGTGQRANDVWYSNTQGRTWLQRANAPWEPRTQVDAETYRSSALGADLLYVANGIGNKPDSQNRINDIWVSSNGGGRWEMVTAAAAYHGRQDAQLLATLTGALLVVAGDTGMTEPFGNVNDVWASLNGGYDWGLCNNTAGFSPREDQVTAIDRSSYLWVMQGEAPDAPFLNDVWRSQTPVTDAQLVALCGLKKPPCGVGLRCMPSNRQCVNHCPPPPEEESSSSSGALVPPTSDASSGLSAAMIVLIVALVLGGLTAVYVAWKKWGGGGQSQAPMGGELGASLTGSTNGLGATEQYRGMESDGGGKQLA